MEINQRWLRRLRTRIAPRTAPGTSPGTLIADPTAPPPEITVIAYGPEEVEEAQIDDPSQLREFKDRWPVLWVNVNGLGGIEAIEGIGRIFDLHPLALEDVVNTNQRPKVEEYDEHLFVVLRMPHLEDVFSTEQVGVFLGPGYVVTFQERRGDPFEPVRRRIRERRTRLLNADYLAYALIDAIIDSYFPLLERFAEQLDRLEDSIAERPAVHLLSEIREVRHDLLALRRAIWPARDMLNALIRDPMPQISAETRTYLRDCHDHAVRIIDVVETYRETGSSLTELYQSTVGHRLNENMRVLTVIATIFIPLTFIAGIYGMNFNTEVSPWNMPELNWYWGYPAAIALMAVAAGAMALNFWRRGWIGR
ncbi:MAG: magnesium/cobalt transporter CorA [Gemmatimonadetes bacterium]|uniref:Magnesium transport protein CorA n=1 Tax=Candidatus Kutchimonas denitrificans TaxID=3056748 RepID=A0AAE5CAT0_9BACT|nr:magnesium/cobalt transporter CorA [Gemmatimonadota bacterium]NIR74897.1 magnesium/cobalt transporter CorA [Candidatus Kutchimonas denitrificans]NIS00009.1 magnesium/cobalt transporter CorA [Gemmatimonadota bacterium]NIT65592.1 magnesium/cobalt transporter CorA [Gemmatimonadota bacterium]NIU52562.1 magnesium/cobalt transporter CorA [Gemmatimonadota bacterium]